MQQWYINGNKLKYVESDAEGFIIVSYRREREAHYTTDWQVVTAYHTNSVEGVRFAIKGMTPCNPPKLPNP